MVEISESRVDNCNPDALCGKYEGEFQEFVDPVEAVDIAISISKSWKNDEPEEDIFIGYGCTFGYAMPFEPDQIKQIKQWAEKEYTEIPTCYNCGELLDPNTDYIIDEYDNCFCSEQCIERAMEKEAEYEILCEDREDK